VRRGVPNLLRYWGNGPRYLEERKRKGKTNRGRGTGPTRGFRQEGKDRGFIEEQKKKASNKNQPGRVDSSKKKTALRNGTKGVTSAPTIL